MYIYISSRRVLKNYSSSLLPFISKQTNPIILKRKRNSLPFYRQENRNTIIVDWTRFHGFNSFRPLDTHQERTRNRYGIIPCIPTRTIQINFTESWRGVRSVEGRVVHKHTHTDHLRRNGVKQNTAGVCRNANEAERGGWNERERRERRERQWREGRVIYVYTGEV